MNIVKISNYQGNSYKSLPKQLNNRYTLSKMSSDIFCLNCSFRGKDYPLHNEKNYIGCIIGGAIGDALGAAVEGKSFHSIQKKFGKEGITDFEVKEGWGGWKKGTITDDTHMTFYTIDGLIKSAIKNFNPNKVPDVKILLESYKDWLKAQNLKSMTEGIKFHHGWISDIENLNHKRTPGGSCKQAIASGIIGTLVNRVNNSKGNGAIMRMAPVGLMYYENPKIAFEAGVDIGCLTHGHPEGYLPAGCLASIIANLIQGKSLEQSIDNTIEILKTYKNHESTLEYINKAREMVRNNIPPSQTGKILGEGSFGSDGLACAIYYSLKNPNDFKKAVLMAVNYSKDNDSVGAITGNIMGAKVNSNNIPTNWKENVEFSKELQEAAVDLFTEPKNIKNKEERYPID